MYQHKSHRCGHLLLRATMNILSISHVNHECDTLSQPRIERDRKEIKGGERTRQHIRQSFQIDSEETLQSQTFSQSLSATTPSILSNGLASYNSFYVLLLYTIRFVVGFRLPELLRGRVAVRVRRPPSLLPPGQGNSRRRGAPGERECRILRGYGKPRPRD